MEPIPVSPKESNNAMMWVILAVAVLLVVMGFWYVIMQQGTNENVNAVAVHSNQDIDILNVNASLDVGTWKNWTNESQHLSTRYPDTWFLYTRDTTTIFTPTQYINDTEIGTSINIEVVPQTADAIYQEYQEGGYRELSPILVAGHERRVFETDGIFSDYVIFTPIELSAGSAIIFSVDFNKGEDDVVATYLEMLQNLTLGD